MLPVVPSHFNWAWIEDAAQTASSLMMKVR